MNVRKLSIALSTAVLVWGLTPETSHAQLFGGGRRGGGVSIGVGTGGYGYGNGYGYGSGYGYGPGMGYPGYYNGMGVGIGIGNRYGSPGYYNGGYYSGYNNTGYYNGSSFNSAPSFANGQAMYTGTTSSYQSNYPTMSNGAMSQSGDPCCCGGGGQMQMSGVNQSAGMFNQGGGTLVVNVPENAQLFWNGMTPMVGTGSSRRFTMAADGSTQKIEARWTGADGKTVTQTRDVTARPNDTVTVDFTSDSNGANSGTNNGANNGTNSGVSSGTNNGATNGTNSDTNNGRGSEATSSTTRPR